MIVEFDESFLKSLRKIKDTKIKSRLKLLIFELEAATDLNEVSALKKLVGYERFYRIRIGNYRLGIEHVADKTIRLVIVLHRKDIYKRFP
ncbi:MAG TPA: type II toxin-antitoxin system RelE/ParE family toxin [Cryomorphaceae bacterium]|nr:type II toxin-antitoxin system RelE/ParE family toxin [Cryomorphaceae bacterium]HKL39270.1 type II toxin-antitoxin system RelE/ParE family toxin [Cryomorphaceae bacterium]